MFCQVRNGLRSNWFPRASKWICPSICIVLIVGDNTCHGSKNSGSLNFPEHQLGFPFFGHSFSTCLTSQLSIPDSLDLILTSAKTSSFHPLTTSSPTLKFINIRGKDCASFARFPVADQGGQVSGWRPGSLWLRAVEEVCASGIGVNENVGAAGVGKGSQGGP